MDVAVTKPSVLRARIASLHRRIDGLQARVRRAILEMIVRRAETQLAELEKKIKQQLDGGT
jgi:hypothetical protein